MKIFQYSMVLLAWGMVTVTGAEDVQGYVSADVPGTLTVEGTSNMHDWSVETAKIEGRVEHDGQRITALTVGVPVKSLESDKAKLNKKMYKALEESDYKLVSFVLSSPARVAPEETEVGWVLPGKLTIRDQTHEVDVLSDVTMDEKGDLLLSGSVTLNMEDWGIDPPTALLGLARTAPEVTVHFEWKLKPGKKQE